MWEALERDRPEAVAVAGYVRPESLAAAAWARRRGVPVVLMSESQAIDRPRVWWKESIKRRRVRRFDAALVGGPAHRDYLDVPGDACRPDRPGVQRGGQWLLRSRAPRRRGRRRRRASAFPTAPYFLAVSRFVPEKNLARLVRAFAQLSPRGAVSEGPGTWSSAAAAPARREVDAA